MTRRGFLKGLGASIAIAAIPADKVIEAVSFAKENPVLVKYDFMDIVNQTLKEYAECMRNNICTSSVFWERAIARAKEEDLKNGIDPYKMVRLKISA